MSDFYRRSVFILAVAVLGFAVWQVLAPFWGALAWSIVLAAVAVAAFIIVRSR